MMEMESPRRSASPEFEFWIVGNSHPELEPSGLLTADELFVDGVLLPLHLLSIPPDPNPEPKSAPPSGFGSGTPEPPTKQDQHQHQHQHQQEEPSAPAATASICREASICSSSPAPSKRWRDIFKVGEKKKESADEKERKERKASNGGGGSGGAAELNINIWPFSRSRSAGTAAGGRPKAAAAAAMRKSSSAPCSRSNSRGEKRWAASPGRPGVGLHVGRASPVWQVRRAGNAGRAAKGSKPKGGNRGLGLNVNSCIGYRNQVSCRGEGCDGGRAANNSNGSLFRFKALFSKKVY